MQNRSRAMGLGPQPVLALLDRSAAGLLTGLPGDDWLALSGCQGGRCGLICRLVATP